MAPTRSFSFSFEGRPISAEPGWTLAAALARAGETRLRETRAGAERGVFCGMGVCQDCLVTVDGAPNRRACMTKATPGLSVARQRFPGILPDRDAGAPPLGFSDLPTESCDVLIIGGGAGGLSAARALAQAGLDVLVLDERPTPGGQYYKQAAGEGSAASRPVMDPQQEEGRALRAEAEAAGVRCLDGAEAWSPAGEAAVLASMDGRTAVYTGRVLLVASGAYERAHVVPGWTLPGVLTTGALQTLIRSYGVLPGKRILIAGNGPLNLQVAVEAAAAGAEVIAAIEAAPMISPGRALQGVRLFAADHGLALKGLRLIQAARKAGIALRFGEVVRAVTCGDGGLDVEAGPLAGGSGRSLQADIVALGYGFLPSNELLRMIGCGQRWDSAFGQLRTVRDDSCETDVKGVFAVGDCAGLGGAPAALCEGVIAAAAIAQRLTGTVPAALEASAAQARADLARHRRFQNALWALYAAPRSGLSLAAPDTLVCRCEEVPKAQIQAAIADGAMTIGDLKRRTRCGMGRCQGRYCGVLVAEELARVTGSPVSETDFFAPRGPVKPVTIADIVGGFR